MDGGSLAASTSLELHGWLIENPLTQRGGAATALAVHRRLVDLASGREGRRLGQVASESRLRSMLISEINTISADVVATVPNSLSVARESGATYLLEFEPHGGTTIRETREFKDLPFASATHALFAATRQLRSLPAALQRLVVESFDLEWQIRNADVHERFAREDDDKAQLAALRRELGALRESLRAIQRQVGPAGERMRALFLRDLSLDNLNRLRVVVETDAEGKPELLHQVSLWYDSAAEALLQPLPLAVENTKKQVAVAKAAWSELQDNKDTLHVLAVWLRALASSTKDPRHCSVCYRHLGDGAKRFCVVHQRVSGQRQPAREFHVGRRFPTELSELLAQAELHDALRRVSSLVSPLERDFQSTRTGLPDALSQPAGKLEALLTAIEPVLGQELHPRAEQLIGSLIKAASIAFQPPQDSASATMAAVHRDRARRWLNWSTFLNAWYSREIPGPYSEASSIRGEESDVDHPVARGEYVDQERVAIHLVKQRAWVRAESFVDKTTYFNVAYASRRRNEGASLREIGRELGTSHEAVRQNLLAVSETGQAKAPRLRMLGRHRTKQDG